MMLRQTFEFATELNQLMANPFAPHTFINLEFEDQCRIEIDVFFDFRTLQFRKRMRQGVFVRRFGSTMPRQTFELLTEPTQIITDVLAIQHRNVFKFSAQVP